jgi:hypothetical protein
LDEIQTKVIRVFLLAIHSHCHSFYSFVTVHCKGDRRKTERKPYLLPYGLGNPNRNPNSVRTLKIMLSAKLYIHEFGFRIHACLEKKYT